MATGDRTLYEVLGVGRDSKRDEIVRAYARLKAEIQKESTAPNPRLAALAKVAHDTLSDPARRAEYDDSIGHVRLAASGARVIRLALVLAALLIAGGGAYWYLVMRAPGALVTAAAQGLAAAELLQAVAPHVGRLQGALPSGEVRELGAAIAVGENEMVTTCRGIAPGMILTVAQDNVRMKAELARSHEALDVCTLTVKGIGEGVKLRTGLPAPQEKLQAILVDNGPAQARLVSVVRTIGDSRGPAFEIKAGAPLRNATPVFDSQARLAGIVTSPHEFGEGVVAALGAARIAQARGAGEVAVAAAHTATAAAPPSAAAAESSPRASARESSRAPSPGAGGRGVRIDEGFSTLWKEDFRGHMVEAMDNVTRGAVGIPIAYWTLWTGRDPERHHTSRCVVTFGADDEIVADYEQVPGVQPADGYWYCALTQYQVRLEDLPVGEYHFALFVDGSSAGNGSIRIEKRFFTPTIKAVVVLVVGLGALAFLRRGKVVKL